jgi:hypothetical protein
MRNRLTAPLAAACLLTVAGCGPAKLDVERTWTLDAEPQMLILEAQPKAQNITVTFDSTDTDVTVLLIKESDIPKDEEGIVPTSKAIAFKSGKSGSFTGELPANTAAKVIVRSPGSKKTQVKVHLTNK